MRFREFLIEYDRNKTAEMVGNKLILALGSDHSVHIPRPIIAARQNVRRHGAKINDIMPPEAQATLTDQILATIEDQDTTPNKAYTPWLARMYAKGGLSLEDINRNQLLGLYDLAKKRRMLKPEHKDINSFKTYKQFEDAMVTYDLEAIENTLDKEEEKGRAKKVYDDENVTIIVPEDEAAACRYGRGTRWCTAATRGQNFFNHYNRQGRMYILLPKNPIREGEKYQLHFQSNQYMDEDDDPVNMYNLLTKRFPNLIDFFLEQEETELKNDLRFTDPNVIQNLLGKMREVGLEWIDEQIVDVEHNDYEYYAEMAKRHGDEDGDIDWEAVHKAGDDYLQWNEYLNDKIDDFSSIFNVDEKDIAEYVANPPDDDGYTIRDIPLIVEEISLEQNGRLRRNTMYDAFFKHLKEIGFIRDWLETSPYR